MSRKIRSAIIKLILLNLLIFGLSSCTSETSISSFEKLSSLDDIIYIEPVEVDADYLDRIEESRSSLRDEYAAYIENWDDTSELIDAEDILCYKIRYISGDAEVIGYISAPADYQTNEYPILIDNRGGNGEYGAVESAYVQNSARYGFVVLASQYRGVDGGTGIDEFGGADVDDVIKLIDFAEIFPFTNGKLYMLGWSRGAMQTYIVLSRDDRVDAAVAGAGPTDLIKFYEESAAPMCRMMRQRIGGSPTTDVEEYIARSAMYWSEMINTPLFIAHGTADERVETYHSQDLFDAMSALGKDVKLNIYPDMDHSKAYQAFERDYLLWLKQQ